MKRSVNSFLLTAGDPRLSRAILFFVCIVSIQSCGTSEDEPTKPDALTITSINPDTGTGGTSVVITGTGFSMRTSNMQVSINGKSCDIVSIVSTQLTITIPTDAGSGKIKISSENVVAESSVFTYTTTATPTTCALDKSLDTDGRVYTEFGGVAADCNAIALQADNRIVSAGTISLPNAIVVLRHTADGQLDNTFNKSGILKSSFGSNYDFCHSVLMDNDKIVIAGSSNGSYAIARLEPSGDFDMTFGNNGKQIVSFGAGKGSSIKKILRQPDGKIVAIGEAYGETSFEFSAARFNSDGTLDGSFGTSGKIIIPIDNLNDFGHDAVLQTDGKIIIVGRSTNTTTGSEAIALIRLHTDGKIDAGFGSGGKVISAVNSTSVGEAIALDASGKILVAGTSDGSMILLRYNTNGTTDTSFGNGGHVITNFDNFGSSKSYAVTIDSKSKIILGGHGWATGMDGLRHSAIVRFNSNGSLDNSFDGDGKMLTVMDPYNSNIFDMTIQPDGKLLLGGSSSVSQGQSNPMLFRIEVCE